MLRWVMQLGIAIVVQRDRVKQMPYRRAIATYLVMDFHQTRVEAMVSLTSY